jgi:hypothetical protein
VKNALTSMGKSAKLVRQLTTKEYVNKVRSSDPGRVG